MSETHDELAGVVDLFGALTRDELTAALTELAFKRGEGTDEDAVETAVEAAIDAYALVAVDSDALGSFNNDAFDQGDSIAEEFLVPGPTAFPSLPSAAEDLPHIMDVPRRTIDREAVGETVRDRLSREATAAVEASDRERAEQLLDISYDLEAWAPIAAEDVRAELDELLEE